MATGKFNHRSRFVRFNLAAVILITFFPLLLGCRGPSPLRSLYNYEVACNRHNRDEAIKYCTANYIENSRDPTGPRTSFVGGRIPVPWELIPSYSEYKDDFTVSITGNTARCIRSNVDVRGSEWVYIMKFTGGGWKLDDWECD